MKAIVEKEVPKVVQAIRQTTSRKVVSKLLTRIKVCRDHGSPLHITLHTFTTTQITEDQAALRQIMRLRGYSLMTNVLEDYAGDMELVSLVCLKCTSTGCDILTVDITGAPMHEDLAAFKSKQGARFQGSYSR